jgi:hypothetical protein
MSPSPAPRLRRGLGPLVIPSLVAYPAGNAGAEVLEQRERICPIASDEISRPLPQTPVRVRVLLNGRRAQIGPIVVRISEGIYDRGSRYVEHGPRRSVQLEFRASVYRQDVRHGGKGDGRNVIPEDVLGPSQDAGGRHLDLARDQSEIAAFAGPKHEAMGP